MAGLVTAAAQELAGRIDAATTKISVKLNSAETVAALVEAETEAKVREILNPFVTTLEAVAHTPEQLPPGEPIPTIPV